MDTDKPGTNVSAPSVPQLEYAPQPSVGDLTLSRRDGVLTIQVRPGWRRILRAAWMLILSMVTLLTLAAWLVSTGSSGSMRNYGGALCIIAVGTISVFAGSVKPILFILRGHKWIVTPNQMEFRGRRLTSIVSEIYPRNTIADLTVERIRLKDRIWKRLGLVIIKPDGNKIVVLFGTRLELEFARRMFKEALCISPDPLGESEYPKISLWSRLQRRLTLDGIVFTIFPPRIGLDGALLIAFVCSTALGIDYWIEHLSPERAGGPEISLIGFTRAMLCSLLVLVIGLYARHKLRKAITLGWTGGFVHLNERSLFNPCSEKWPIDQVESFIFQTVNALRSHLSVKLRDASVIPLIQGGSAREVQLAFQMLNTAMRRQRTPAPVIT